MARGNKGKKGKGSKGQNRKTTDDFLTKNKQKPGVIETSSGLQYVIVDDAQGEKPTENSFLTVEQRITLVDGSVLADTYKQVEQEEFNLKEGIDGLKEGIQLMSKGARYKFFIPPHLAWGKRGAGTKIGPFATIIIDVRLVDFY